MPSFCIKKSVYLCLHDRIGVSPLEQRRIILIKISDFILKLLSTQEISRKKEKERENFMKL